MSDSDFVIVARVHIQESDALQSIFQAQCPKWLGNSAQRAAGAHGCTQAGGRFDARVWKPLSVPCIDATVPCGAKQGNDAIKGLENSTAVGPWIWLKQNVLSCVSLCTVMSVSALLPRGARTKAWTHFKIKFSTSQRDYFWSYLQDGLLSWPASPHGGKRSEIFNLRRKKHLFSFMISEGSIQNVLAALPLACGVTGRGKVPSRKKKKESKGLWPAQWSLQGDSPNAPRAFHYVASPWMAHHLPKRLDD